MERLLTRSERLYLNADRLLGGALTLLARTALAFEQDDGAVHARSIAYYALFSLCPLLLILFGFARTTLAWEDAQAMLIGLVEDYTRVPAGVVENYFAQVLRASSTVGILALLGLIWAASGVFTAVYRAVNRAWGNPKAQLFWTEKLYGLAVVLAAGLLLAGTTIYFTIASVLRSWQSKISDWLPMVAPSSDWLSSWLGALVPVLISVVLFFLIYRTMPRNRVTWRDVWLGGLLAGLIWEGARQVFAWYLGNVANYSLIYGSLGAVIGFLLWAYLSAMIVLLGAEFTAQHSAWRRAGRPIESRPPRQWFAEWSKWNNR